MATEHPDELASRVLRRAQVSKMTRTLQSSLALANVKCKHGWENLSLDTIEPRLNMELSRKRPTSSNDTISDSSSFSGDHSSIRALQSSPLTLPIFSDDFDRSGGRSVKRQRVGGGGGKTVCPASSSRTGRKSQNANTVNSWKRSLHLSQSSPSVGSRYTNFTNSAYVSRLSLIPEASTFSNRQISPELSEDDDTDLPVHSFALQQSMIASSPPRTPPPQRRLLNKDSNVSWSRTPGRGEEGADLLMYLATSPTPAGNNKRALQILVPSTPPTKGTPLPSSIMNTPGNHGLFGFPNTPTTNFNFADFCNVTPSPAQTQWPKTPATAKTPLAVSSARRRLTFDTLIPPSQSPTMSRRKSAGLGMDLGGELVS